MIRFERVFEAQQWIPRPLAEVFPFFAAARNLERIVRREVEGIFAYRRKAIEESFGRA